MNEVRRLLVAECEVVVATTLRLLKTTPSLVSSSSESISTTPLFFSRGTRVGEAWAAARGTTAIGAEGAEAPAPLSAPCGAQAYQPA